MSSSNVNDEINGHCVEALPIGEVGCEHCCLSEAEHPTLVNSKKNVLDVLQTHIVAICDAALLPAQTLSFKHTLEQVMSIFFDNLFYSKKSN